MITEATVDDIPGILDLCEEFWKHTMFDEPFIRDHAKLMLDMFIANGLLAILTEDNKIVGVLGGVKAFLTGSDHAIAGTEAAWWISPEYRIGKKVVDLIRFAEDLAKKQGIKYWSMAAMETSNPVKTDRLLQLMGYKKSETIYTKVIG